MSSGEVLETFLLFFFLDREHLRKIIAIERNRAYLSSYSTKFVTPNIHNMTVDPKKLQSTSPPFKRMPPQVKILQMMNAYRRSPNISVAAQLSVMNRRFACRATQ